MSRQDGPIHRFAGFELHPGERRLLGKDGAINLAPKVFDTLVLLVEQAGHAVSKAELMQALWPRGFVEEANLSRNIWQIRNALHDHGTEPHFIETVPKLGYRFIAPVESGDGKTPAFDRRKSKASADAGDPSVGNASSAAPQTSADAAETSATTQVPASALKARRLPRNGYLLLALLLIAAIIAVQSVWRHATRVPLPVQATVDTHETAPAKSIAVLPFENLSEDKGNKYFADGMQDLILTKLADIGDLKVISRTSTAQYSSHPDDLKTIAQQLGVATILEGSVQKAGNQVLINVQLIDAHSDSHIWAQSYQRTLDNIFGVEGEVASKIAAAMKAKLTPTETAAVARIPTHNKQAYDAYLKAVYYGDDFNRTRAPEENTRAVALLKDAVQLDPAFSEAYGALAFVYVHQGRHLGDAETAAAHALALDPGDANAHRMMAYVMAQRGKPDQAIAQAQQAVHLQPAKAVLWNGLGNVYYWTGHLDEAARTYRHVLELDPKPDTNGWAQLNLAQVLEAQRRYGDARDLVQWVTTHDPGNLSAAVTLAAIDESGWGDLAAARKALQAVPAPVASSGMLSDAWFWWHLYAHDPAAALEVIAKAPAAWFVSQSSPREMYQALAHQAEGDQASAKSAFAQARVQLQAWISADPADAKLHAQQAIVLAGLGQGNEAQREIHRALSLQPIEKYPLVGLEWLAALAQVDARTGRGDAAIDRLRQLLAMPAGDLISVPLLKIDAAWDPIRTDPRFQALLTKGEN